MYRYRIEEGIEKIIPKVNLVSVQLNKDGFADLLSSNLELLNDLKYAKNKINQINSFLWEDLKKYTNPYELIYAFSNRKGWEANNSIADVKPLSRSFFKMIEMIYEFIPELGNKTYNTKEVSTSANRLISLHIAEGPGGFIEATRYLRHNIISDYAFGITLLDNEIKCVPAWKQSGFFLRNNPNVIISTGIDGTGNIYNPENIKYLSNQISNKLKQSQTINNNLEDDKLIKDNLCYDIDIENEEIKHNSLMVYGQCKFITADGGFDYSIDYNYQEQASSKLLFSQILGALTNEAKDGTFICKMFDINLYISIEMIYILYICYKEIIIFKPHTSRVANSEKYLICRKFKGINQVFLDELFQILNNWNQMNENDKTINQLFDDIPQEFIKQIKEINKKIVIEQIKIINNVIHIYHNKLNLDNHWKHQNLKKQYDNAVSWCNKYKIPYKTMPFC
jgi:23S rRNA U2552 (ribose-2'-O)-methylase RlmE/FtsJ